MSGAIDNRVVSIEFDNKEFEQNVKESMNTLKKLDQTVDSIGKNTNSLEDISDSLSDISKVKFNVLESAIGRLSDQFYGLKKIANIALGTIVQDATREVEKLFKSFTFDQVGRGFEKFEAKTTAVQTILAATGENIETVEQQLDKLLWYTDETSYKFSDMINTIGKFTSAGIGLEDSVKAMEGISNWAAISGQNTQAAASAMMNLSQALGSGAVMAKDWASIENANMATAAFKKNVIDLAVQMGRLKKKSDGTITTLNGKMKVTAANMRSTLSAGWFDSDVLIKVLGEYGDFADKFYEFTERTGQSATESLRILDNFMHGMSDADVKQLAKDLNVSETYLSSALSTLASDEMKVGREATIAAREAKTFHDLTGSITEAVSTQWMRMFENIFGNYEQQKEFWTNLSDDMWDIFAGPLDAINEKLESQLGSNWDKITKQVKSCGIEVDDFKESIAKVSGYSSFDELIEKNVTFEEYLSKTTNTAGIFSEALRALAGEAKGTGAGISAAEEELAKMNDLVNSVRRGDWGNGQERFAKLAKAGYDWVQVQSLVDKVCAGGKITFEDLNLTISETTEVLSDDAIALLELADALDDSGSEVNGFASNINQLSGREYLLQGIQNVVSGISTVLSSIREAWSEAFPSSIFDNLYSIARGFAKATEAITDTDKISEVIHGTFGGLFKMLSMVKTVVSSLCKVFINLSGIILKVVGGTIFEAIFGVISLLGKLVSIIDLSFIVKALDWVATKVRDISSSISIWINGKLAKAFDFLNERVEKLKDAFPKVKDRVADFTKSLIDTAKGFSLSAFVKGGGIARVLDSLADKFRNFNKLLSSGGIKQYFKGLSSRFKSFDISFITDSLSELPNLIKTKLEETDWKSIGSSIGSSLKGLGKALGATFTLVFEKIGESVNGIVDKLVTAFQRFIEDFPKTFDTVKTKISDALGVIDEQLAQHFPSIHKLLNNMLSFLKEKGKDSLGFADDMVIGVIDAITKLSTAVFGKIPGVSEKITSGFEAIKGAFAGVKEVLKKDDFGEKIKSWTTSITAFAASFAFVSHGIATLKTGKGLFDFLKKYKTIAGTIKDFIKGLGANFSTLVKSIAGFFKGLSKVANSMVIKNVGLAMLSIAGSLLLIVSAIAILQNIYNENTDKAVSVVYGLILIMGGLVALMTLMAKNSSLLGDAKVASLARAGVSFVASLLLLVVAIKKIGDAGWNVESFVGGMVPIIMVLALFDVFFLTLAGISAISKNLKIGEIGKSMLGAAASIFIIIGAMNSMMKIMSGSTPSTIWNAIGMILLFGVLMGAIVGLAGISEGVKWHTGLAFIGAAIAINSIVKTMQRVMILQAYNPAGIGNATRIVLALLAMMAVIGLASSNWDKGTATAFLALGAAVDMIAIAIAGLSILPDSADIAKATKQLMMIVGLFAIIGLVMDVMNMIKDNGGSGGFDTLAKSLLKVGIACVLFAGSVAMLAGVSIALVKFGNAIYSILSVIIVLAAALTILAWTFNSCKVWAVVGAVAMIAVIGVLAFAMYKMSDAIGPLVTGLENLITTFSQDGFTKAILIAAGNSLLLIVAFALLGVACLTLSVLALPLILEFALIANALANAETAIVAITDVIPSLGDSMTNLATGLFLLGQTNFFSLAAGLIATAAGIAILGKACSAAGIDIGTSLKSTGESIEKETAEIPKKVDRHFKNINKSLEDGAEGIEHSGKHVKAKTRQMAQEVNESAEEIDTSIFNGKIEEMFNSDALQAMTAGGNSGLLDGLFGSLFSGDMDMSGMLSGLAPNLQDGIGGLIQNGSFDGIKDMLGGAILGSESDPIDMDETAGGFIDNLKGSLESKAEGLKETGTMAAETFIQAFDNGIVNNQESISAQLQETVATAAQTAQVDFATTFEEGSGMVNDLANGLGTALVTGFDEAQNNFTEKVRNVMNAGANILRNTYGTFYADGNYIGQGIARGIDSASAQVNDAIRRLAASADYTIRVYCQIKSPSRLFAEDGKYMALGVAKGIEDNIPSVEEATEMMAKAAITTATDMANRIASTIEDADSPVITPVLDLTNVDSKLGKLGSSMSVGATVRASNVSSSMNASEVQNGTDLQNSETKGSTITFTQNNYSPKSLSRVEIYRQTRNQLTAAKGVI